MNSTNTLATSRERMKERMAEEAMVRARLRMIWALIIPLGIGGGLILVNGQQKTPASQQSAFDINNVTDVAVYQYSRCYGELNDAAIKFKISNRNKVSEVTREFVFPVNLGDVGTSPSAYVYLRDSAGHVAKGRVVLDWDYVVLGNNWDEFYPLTEAGKTVLKACLQKCGGRTVKADCD